MGSHPLLHKCVIHYESHCGSEMAPTVARASCCLSLTQLFTESPMSQECQLIVIRTTVSVTIAVMLR